jgi:hypothetical protein
MASLVLSRELAKAAVDILAAHNGVVSHAARAADIPRQTFDSRIKIARKRYGLVWAPSNDDMAPQAAIPPRVEIIKPTGQTRRWLLTAAQNDCAVHGPFFDNLRAYAAHLGAELLVAKFTYNLSVVRDRATAAAGSDEERRLARNREWTWADELTPYLVDEPRDCGPLTFFADMNQLPTASDPLSSLDTHSRGRWAVFPHAKVRLKTVPAAGDSPPVLMTTGAVTVEDYTDTKAGIKAVFHHVIGATLVEVDSGGRLFTRQINATQDGSFQDMCCVVTGGRVITGQHVEAITFGDIQSPFLDAGVAMSTWGFDVAQWRTTHDACMVEALKPRYGFVHDLIDFKSISHHDAKSFSERYRAWANGNDSVVADIKAAADFLSAIDRHFMQVVAVESNHDKWLDRWLDDAQRGLRDLKNARTWHELNSARLAAIEMQDDEWSTWAHALRNANPALGSVQFVPEGGSYLICQGTRGGAIECGSHGHLGPNGGPSAPKALSRAAGKANIGDKHSPEIIDGLYVSGTSSHLRLGYNKGPSSWRHAHTVTYPNGKRTLNFIQGDRWRA